VRGLILIVAAELRALDCDEGLTLLELPEIVADALRLAIIESTELELELRLGFMLLEIVTGDEPLMLILDEAIDDPASADGADVELDDGVVEKISGLLATPPLLLLLLLLFVFVLELILLLPGVNAWLDARPDPGVTGGKLPLLLPGILTLSDTSSS
jgi:hypothetical protein